MTTNIVPPLNDLNHWKMRSKWNFFGNSQLVEFSQFFQRELILLGYPEVELTTANLSRYFIQIVLFCSKQPRLDKLCFSVNLSKSHFLSSVYWYWSHCGGMENDSGRKRREEKFPLISSSAIPSRFFRETFCLRHLLWFNLLKKENEIWISSFLWDI